MLRRILILMLLVLAATAATAQAPRSVPSGVVLTASCAVSGPSSACSGPTP